MPTHELLGLDVGKSRTGLARASSVAKLAEPLQSLATDQALKTVVQMIKENNVQTLVVGLPRNLKGDDTAQTKWVRDWVVKAKEVISIPMYWQDEALTSKLVEAHKFKNKNIDDHSLAAAIILQDFLDAPEAERVSC